jgi:hypothetical protein
MKHDCLMLGFNGPCIRIPKVTFMSQVELNINRTFYSLDVHADMPLLCLLRDKLNLVGTRQGTRSI